MKIRILFSFVSLALFFSFAAAQTHVSFRPLLDESYENVFSPAVIARRANVYETADTQSRVLAQLKRGDPVQILERGEFSRQHDADSVNAAGKNVHFTWFETDNWYSIGWQNCRAYIRARDIATHVFGESDSVGYSRVFLVRDYSPGYNPVYSSCTLYKVHGSDSVFSDTLVIENFRTDIGKQIEFGGLDKSRLLIHLSEVNAYCGGTQTEVFISDSGKGLSLLTKTSSYADDGGEGSRESSVWLPVRLGNGKIIHVQNGNLATVFNTYNGALSTLKIPDDLGVPKNQIVARREFETAPVYNSAGEMLFDADGAPKLHTVKNSTTYYRWTGTALKKIR